MCCTGIQICENNVPSKILSVNKTTRLVNMALEMMKFVENFSTSKGKKLKLKIGIHQGNVIAGVIGDHKPQFSLIGDTVNTTSRVCSTGECGEITLSEDATKHVNIFAFRLVMKTVEAKGKGKLNVYQIQKRSNHITSKFQRITYKILEKFRNLRKLPDSPNCPSHSTIVKTMNYFGSFIRNSTNNIGSRDPTLIIENPIIPSSPTNPQRRLRVNISLHTNQQRPSKNRIVFSKPLPNIQNDVTLSYIVPKANKKKISLKTLVKRISVSQKIIKLVEKFKQIMSYIKHVFLPESKTKILPMNISQSIMNFEGKEKLKENPVIPEKGFVFYSFAKKQYLEFMKQLIGKRSALEKLLLLTLFFFEIIRTFLTLAISSFYEESWFFIFNIIFLMMLGLLILFMREFLSNVAKKPILKLLLLTIFIIGLSSSFLEMHFSIISDNYPPAFMNIVILFMALTNAW